VLLLSFLLSLAAGSSDPVLLPIGSTAVDQLSTDQLAHHELVRLRKDWGERNFQVVLDGWTRRGTKGKIADVRLWWFKAHKQGNRGEFGSKSRRHFEVSVNKRSAERWDLRLGTKGKSFVFQVESDGAGGMAAYATVVTREGVVSRCLTTRGELKARKFLGIPTGIDRLDVTCTDPDGRVRRGRVQQGS
jgi:hypothetical protein